MIMFLAIKKLQIHCVRNSFERIKDSDNKFGQHRETLIEASLNVHH
jgi:hypothetical protein